MSKIWDLADFKARRGQTPVREVAVPGQDAKTFVRGMTGRERGEYEQAILEKKGKSREMNLKSFRGEILARTVVSEQGERLFESKDAEWLSDLPAMETEPIVDMAMKLSGIGEADVEELVGN